MAEDLAILTIATIVLALEVAVFIGVAIHKKSESMPNERKMIMKDDIRSVGMNSCFATGFPVVRTEPINILATVHEIRKLGIDKALIGFEVDISEMEKFKIGMPMNIIGEMLVEEHVQAKIQHASAPMVEKMRDPVTVSVARGILQKLGMNEAPREAPWIPNDLEKRIDAIVEQLGTDAAGNPVIVTRHIFGEKFHDDQLVAVVEHLSRRQDEVKMEEPVKAAEKEEVGMPLSDQGKSPFIRHDDMMRAKGKIRRHCTECGFRKYGDDVKAAGKPHICDECRLKGGKTDC